MIIRCTPYFILYTVGTMYLPIDNYILYYIYRTTCRRQTPEDHCHVIIVLCEVTETKRNINTESANIYYF